MAEVPELSEDEEMGAEQNGKRNTIWNIVMKGKSRDHASEAELKVMEEIESLISKQPEVQKTMQHLKNLEDEFEDSN